MRELPLVTLTGFGVAREVKNTGSPSGERGAVLAGTVPDTGGSGVRPDGKAGFGRRAI